MTNALSTAVLSVLPVGNDRHPDNRVVAFYLTAGELRALRELASKPAEQIAENANCSEASGDAVEAAAIFARAQFDTKHASDCELLMDLGARTYSCSCDYDLRVAQRFAALTSAPQADASEWDAKTLKQVRRHLEQAYTGVPGYFHARINTLYSWVQLALTKSQTDAVPSGRVEK